MKNISFSLLASFLLISMCSYSQGKKYQGLLWEISGNGLTEPSYLYGTMHVSNKLAFNVSDAFYNCLENVDAIGLESSPDGWMQDYRDMGSFSPYGYGYNQNFYKNAFKVEHPGTAQIYSLLENKNSMMNQILYRYVPGAEDYQENTFLDMFIYQAGAKNNKPVYSLERLDEVIELSIRAMTPDKEGKRENNNNSYLEKDDQMKFMLLEEAYRRGDLDQIDSLSQANTPTKVYHKYFIVERNRNIVNRMDSLMKIHSMFTGIGAAHLPGNEGAIELLRKKGYQVKAVSPKATGKSHKMRKKFIQQYNSVEFQATKTEDEFISVAVPGKLFEMPTSKRGRLEYFCPEPVNGGYFSIVRLFTYGPLYQRDPEFYKATFDSLLYIATPGELIKKEDVEYGGYEGYNILTKTSKNAFVNYKVFFTPTEVVIFKGSGNGEYIQKAEPQKFFTDITLASGSNDWIEIKPKFGGAKWKMKGNVTSQDMIEGLGDTEVDPVYQSFDQESGDYFMVMRNSLNDLEYIEEDSFDLAYLGESFAKSLGYEVEVSSESRNGNKLIIEQYLKLADRRSKMAENVKIKLTAKGGTYYLMLAVASEENGREFFDSFDFIDFVIDDKFETHTDSALLYKVETIKPETGIDYTAMAFSMYRDSYSKEENVDYLSDSKNATHTLAKTNEEIQVTYTKFHDYAAAESEEDFWDYQIEQLNDDETFIVSRREKGTFKEDQTLVYLFSDTNSSRGILTKLHLHGGVMYSLQTLIDTVDGPSKYVQTFYDTFEPLDTIVGRDVFEDKAALFYEHAMDADSLNRLNAMKSINEVEFEEKDVANIIDIYKKYVFDEESELLDRENLIMSLGNVESEEAYDFLYETFDENTFNSEMQFAVLKSFSYTETEEAYEAIRRLLLENTPVTDNFRKLNFFNNLYDSLELAENFFPELLEVGQSLPEYKPHLIELLAWGFSDSIFSAEHFIPEASVIKRDAMIELKRAVADLETAKHNSASGLYGRGSLYSSYHTILLDYYTLMVGLRQSKVAGTEKFFEGLKRMDLEEFVIEQQIINHLLGEVVDTVAINKIANDIDYRVWTYNRLDDYEMLEYYPKSITQKEIAEGILYYQDVETKDDSIAFLSAEYVSSGKDEGYVYFFKRKNKDNQYWVIDYCGMQPKEPSEFSSLFQSTKRGLAYKNEEEMRQTIDKTLEIFKYANRERVEISTSYDWGGLGGMFDY